MASNRRRSFRSIGKTVTNIDARLRYLQKRPAPRKIAARVVATTNIVPNAVTTVELAPNAVTPTELAPEVSTAIDNAQTSADNAQTSADNAQDAADAAAAAAAAAASAASTAQSTANGKNKIYRQASQPTGGTYAEGDLWFDTDDDNKFYRYTSGSWSGFTLGDNALASLSANKITAGTIDASVITVSNIDAGRITTGHISAGDTEIGNDVGPGTGHYGISLSSTDFNNIFLRRSDGVYFFRVGAGLSNSIQFDSNSGLSIAGSISGASSINVGSSTSLGYMYLQTSSDLIVNGMRFQNRQYAGWHNSFYPYLDAQYDLSVVTNPSQGVYRWDNIYYIGSIVDQSDERTKNSIETSDLGLDFINRLRPVSYFKNASKKIARQDENGEYLRDENENILYDELPGKRRHYGLIAQEVRQVIDDLGKTSFDFSGWGKHDPDDPDSEQTLTYMEFISPIIKAVQELDEKVENLTRIIQSQ